MEQNELDRLIDKYLRGTASETESQTLMEWYRGRLEGDVVWDAKDEEEEALVKARMSSRIQEMMHRDREDTVVEKRAFAWKWPAAVAAAIIGALLWFYPDSPGDEDGTTPAVVNIADNAQENRFVLLPDSSKVILRPGSRLEYKTDFQGDTREVVLIGEGYFDIHRDENRPFIIHTGEVKTVVLGTAFTIKAEEGKQDVQVTVQRGKVRVEREEAVLGELLADEQLIVEGSRTIKKSKEELSQKIEQAIAWTADDMRFDAQPFGVLVKRLERRYGVRIKFEDNTLAKCPISGKFEGTETLEEVLASLCVTRNASFRSMQKNVFEIQGQGCE